jgi:hypothetical protein
VIHRLARRAGRVAGVLGLTAATGLGAALVPSAPALAAPGGTVVGVEQGVGIFSMSSDGAGLHYIKHDPAAAAVAAAPGSDLVAYGDTGSPVLTIASATGPAVASVLLPGTTGSVTAVAWSPDGQEVAYTVCTTAGSCQIQLAGIDGQSRGGVAAPAGVDPDRGLAWGAQGLVAAGSFTAVTGCAGCPAGVYLLDHSGQTPPTQLVRPGGLYPEVGQPALSARGNLAYVGSALGGPAQVLVSGAGLPLTAVRGSYSGPAWSPDGSTLLVTNGYQVLEDRPIGGMPQAIATFPAYGVTSLSWTNGLGATPGCSVALPAGSVRGIGAAPTGGGYWITDAYGAVSACGNAGDFGGLSALHLNQPVLGVAGTSDGGGYFLVAYDGGVFTFGDAAPASLTGSPGMVSLGGLHLAAPIWAMAPTPSGHGYWLAGTDGGVFTFGDAVFRGSAANLHPAHPLVGMAVTRTGKGYWLATSDGSVYAFGDATGARLGTISNEAAAIVGIATDPAVPGGYWLAGADGTVTGFGGAPSLGSASAAALGGPVRGIAATPGGQGYWLVDANGTVFPFGAASSAGNAN